MQVFDPTALCQLVIEKGHYLFREISHLPIQKQWVCLNNIMVFFSYNGFRSFELMTVELCQKGRVNFHLKST